MRKLLIFILFAFLAVPAKVNAQTPAISSYKPPTYIPSSPEAALLGRFGDIPVSYYTGTANVSIPLHDIKVGNHSIPLTLSYHTSGVKVSDEATWVGLGWSLEPEATIIQEVRGLPDGSYNNESSSDFTAFKNYHFPPITMDNNYYESTQVGIDGEPSNCGTLPVGGYDTAYIINRLEQGRYQPDIFNFNLGGVSGKFTINHDNNQIVMLETDEDVVISSSFFNFIDFTVKTLDGTIYTFGAQERSYRNGAAVVSGYTYKVTRIQYPEGKTVLFTYADETMQTVSYNESSTLYGGEFSQPFDKDEEYVTIYKKRLAKIETPDEIVAFVPEDRLDLISTTSAAAQRLKRIDISSAVTLKKIRSFEFNYTYFASTGIGRPNQTSFETANAGSLSKRLKLDSVREIGYASNGDADTSKPPYVLQYDTSVTMPNKNSWSIDFWGYYNGRSNSRLLPNLDFFQYPTKEKYAIGIFNTNSGSYTPNYFSYPYIGATRYTDNAFAKANMLNKITYPTGGYTELAYEPNSFTNQFIPNAAQASSVNTTVSALKSQVALTNQPAYPSPTTYRRQFTLNATTTLHFNNTITTGIPNNAQSVSNNYADIGKIYSNAKIVLTIVGQAQPLMTWAPNQVYTNSTDFGLAGSINWVLDYQIVNPSPSNTYVIEVSYPTDLAYAYPNEYGSNSSSQINYVSTSGIDMSVSEMAGFRIKNIKNYTAPGVLASNKELTYTGGKLLNKFEPLQIIYTNNKTGGGVTNGNGYEYIGFYKRIFISSADFGMNGGNPVGYGQVEEKELSPTAPLNIGKTVYSYYNTENVTKIGLPMIPNRMNGKTWQEKIVRADGTDLKYSMNTYTETSVLPLMYGLTIQRKSFGNEVPCDWHNYMSTPYTTFYYQAYGGASGAANQFNVYPIVPSRIKQTAQQTTEYFNGAALTTSKAFAYNTNGTLNNSITTTSADDQLKQVYSYANNYPYGGQAFEAAMIADNLLSVPVKTTSLKNNVLTSETKNEYAKDSSTENLNLPKYVYAKKGGEPSLVLEKKVTMVKYDSQGNLLQYNLENGTPVSIVWGYKKTKPVAQLQNVAYASISSQTITDIENATANQTAIQNEATLNGALASLRTAFPLAMISTYTYKHGVGVQSITDAKGQKTTFEYDNFGRLKTVKDFEGRILSENEYHFRP